MIYKKAWQRLSNRPKAVVWSIGSGVLAAVLLWLLSSAGPFDVAIGTILAIYTLDAGRAMATVELAGRSIDWGSVTKRLCVDSFFLAMLFLLFAVIPLAQAVAVERSDPVTASIIGIVWYLMLAGTAALALRWFYWGFIASVGGRDVEGALIEAVKRFEASRRKAAKHFAAYWFPFLLWLAGNAALNGLGLTGALISYGILVAAVIPFMEATYVAANEQ